MPESSPKHTVLVLGASGKLGRLVQRWWQLSPAKELSPLWQYRTNPRMGGIVWAPGDPIPSDLGKVSTIVALWGVTPGPGRDLADNTRLAQAAMDLGTGLGVERVLHLSSAAVYQPGPAAVAETDAGQAPNPYGKAKRDMENAIKDWSAQNPGGPRNTVLRLANVTGADSLFAAIATNPDSVTIDRFDTGKGPCRSYISPAAFARVIQALVTCPIEKLPEVLNVATPTALAMEDLARACGRRVLWKPAPINAAPMVWLDTRELSRIIALDNETPEQIAALWTRLKDPQ